MDYLKAYKKMLLIRKFEQILLHLFSTNNEIKGTIHTCIGQEAIAVALSMHLKNNDIIFSNHRSHGHFIACIGNISGLFAEIMGKGTGVCGGRGGSQHLCLGNFYSNGIQGGIVGNAVGAALAEKMNKTDNIVIAFLGDGTLGQGLVYESLNFASLKSLPILFILENNQYAQSTPIKIGVSGSIVKRAEAFGIESNEITSNNIKRLYNRFKTATKKVRNNKKPFFQVVNTYRLGPHSKRDDFRNEKEIRLWKKKDPLTLICNKIPRKKNDKINNKVNCIINEAYLYAKGSSFQKLDINKESFKHKFLISIQSKTYRIPPFSYVKQRYITSINESLYDLLGTYGDTFIIGEDITDPYGGAFKATKGLSTAFLNRVISTPISEAGIVAWAVGAAMRGWRPIIEIMFGDFITLAVDQIINHACKYEWMYDEQVKIPITIRTPMGGYKGYGPTHSQTLEKIFIGIPGLSIVSPSHLLDPGILLKRAVLATDMPTLFVENKSLYGKYLVHYENNNRLGSFYIEHTNTAFPTLHLSLTNFEQSNIVLLCYGGMVPLAISVVEKLLTEDELSIDLVVPSLIYPIPIEEIKEYTNKYYKIIILEESNIEGGWGSEIIAQLMENRMDVKRFLRIGGLDIPIPCSNHLEEKALPNLSSICTKIKKEFT